MPRAVTVQRERPERRAATEQRLLTATRRLLESGIPFTVLSTSRIVEEAGVSRPTFYIHFASKQQLLQRLAADVLGELTQAASGFIDDPRLGRAELRASLDRVLEVYLADAAVLAGVLELAAYDTETAKAYDALISEVAARTAVHIQRRRKLGGRRHRSPEMTASVLAWMVERACTQIARGADQVTLDELAETLTDVIWVVLERD